MIFFVFSCLSRLNTYEFGQNISVIGYGARPMYQPFNSIKFSAIPFFKNNRKNQNKQCQIVLHFRRETRNIELCNVNITKKSFYELINSIELKLVLEWNINGFHTSSKVGSMALDENNNVIPCIFSHYNIHIEYTQDRVERIKIEPSNPQELIENAAIRFTMSEFWSERVIKYESSIPKILPIIITMCLSLSLFLLKIRVPNTTAETPNEGFLSSILLGFVGSGLSMTLTVMVFFPFLEYDYGINTILMIYYGSSIISGYIITGLSKVKYHWIVSCLTASFVFPFIISFYYLNQKNMFLLSVLMYLIGGALCSEVLLGNIFSTKKFKIISFRSPFILLFVLVILYPELFSVFSDLVSREKHNYLITIIHIIAYIYSLYVLSIFTRSKSLWLSYLSGFITIIPFIHIYILFEMQMGFIFAFTSYILSSCTGSIMVFLDLAG